MKEIKLLRHRIKLYDNIDELPIKNYNLVNQYALIDYEIGHTLEDVNKHFGKMDTFMSSQKWDEAVQARKNLHQTFWNMINGTNFPALQFGCFIQSIDGKVIEDYSKEGIEGLYNKLDGLDMGTVKSTLAELKKKSKRN